MMMASGKFHNSPADQSLGKSMSENWELKNEKNPWQRVPVENSESGAMSFFTGGIGE